MFGLLGLLGLFGSLGLRRRSAGFGAAAVDAVPAVGGCTAVATSTIAAFAAAAGRFRKIITKYRPLKIFNIDFSAKSNGFR